MPKQNPYKNSTIFGNNTDEIDDPNQITAKDVIEYYRCGDYGGYPLTINATSHNENGVRTNIHCDAEETCFGNYMYLIENTLGMWHMDPEYRDSEYMQGKIDMFVAMIENYALNCVDFEKRTVTFSDNDFRKQFEKFIIPDKKGYGKSLGMNSALMPYTIQYILMQHGIKFKDPNYTLEHNGYDLPGIEIEPGFGQITVADTKRKIKADVAIYLLTTNEKKD